MARQARKGSKIKVVEPNSKKERCNVKAPMVFKHRDVVEIVINRMVSTKVASDGHVGHVVEPSVADPMESDKCVTYSLKLRCDDINNRDCLPVIHWMRLTNDKNQTLIKKWASLADSHADDKTADGHMVWMFFVAMTSLKMSQIKNEPRAAAEVPERHDQDDDGGCSLEGLQRDC